MAHEHEVYDSEPHFTIDPKTRAISYVDAGVKTVVQFDHNSEAFTFELPKIIDGHDMTECNVIRVHYRNSGSSDENDGIYLVTDLQVSETDPEKLTCTWLISNNATSYNGNLVFSLEFSCTVDGLLYYAWNTLPYKSITVAPSINNTKLIIEEPDILLNVSEQCNYAVAMSDDAYAVAEEALENAEEANSKLIIEDGNLYVTDRGFKIRLNQSPVTPKGEWNNLTTYNNNDIVSYHGSSYFVLKTVTGVAPVEGQYYTLVASRGEVGATGANGTLETSNNTDERYLPKATVEGVIPQPTLAINGDVSNYQIYGNSVQEGTPTPETPVAIESVGDLVTDETSEHYGKYKVELRCTGDNLFYLTLEDFQKKPLQYLRLKPNTTYTLSSNAPMLDESTTNIYFNGGSTLENGVWNGQPRTVTTDKNGELYIQIQSISLNNIFTNYWIHLNEGSVPTEYSINNVNIMTAYLYEPLRKFGDYADYIDWKEQKVVRNIKERTLDGTESVIQTTSTPNDFGIYNYRLNILDAAYTDQSEGDKTCSNYYKSTTKLSNEAGEPSISLITRNLYIRERMSTLSELTTWLKSLYESENPFKFIYTLATPTEEPIEIDNLVLEEGTNNVFLNTATPPSNIKVDYFQNPTLVNKNLSGGLSDLVFALTAEKEGGIPIKDYKSVQSIVERGLAPQLFNIGDQFIVNHEVYGECALDVIGFNHDVIPGKKYSMTLQFHDLLPDVMAIDAAEAAWYIDEETYPNGLAAGTYYFALPSDYETAYGGGTMYNFTLTKPVLVGGQIRVAWSYQTQVTANKVTTFESVGNSITLETVSIVLGQAGTAMPTLSITAVTKNTNCIHRMRYGSNSWEQSAIRQWLNTDKLANAWWTPQTNFDRPPSYANKNGFLNGLDPEFLSIVCPVEKKTQLSISDGYGLETTVDKFFLLSRPEVFAGVERSADGAEGTVYKYYEEFSDSSEPSTLTDSNRIKYVNGTSAYWCLRTSDDDGGYAIRGISQSGTLYSVYANVGYGVAPACVIG